MGLDFKGVLNTGFVKEWINTVCGADREIIQRPAAFFVRNRNEGNAAVERVIILPPKGYTANSLNQTNSHDEALRATIQIKGAVREGKQGFSKLQNCLLVAAFNSKRGSSDLNVPYLTFEIGKTPNLSTVFHSAGTPPFAVVKENGFGFYHNLINVSNDWLVMELNKRLRPQKKVDLSSQLANLSDDKAELLKGLYNGVVAYGDEVFSKLPELVNGVVKLPPEISLPALGEMLFAYDTGRHEACSAFAMILKVGKRYPDTTLEFLEIGAKNKTIPHYYANQLLDKLKRWQNPSQNLENLNFG